MQKILSRILTASKKKSSFSLREKVRKRGY